jgi:hypothetical protein
VKYIRELMVSCHSRLISVSQSQWSSFSAPCELLLEKSFFGSFFCDQKNEQPKSKMTLLWLSAAVSCFALRLVASLLAQDDMLSMTLPARVLLAY